MSESFLSQIVINSVRHLQNCEMTLSKQERRHLILTGRNGSGKTAVLEAIWDALQHAAATPPVTLTFEQMSEFQRAQQDNACVLAHYPASFSIEMHEPEGTTTVGLPSNAEIEGSPGQWFLRHVATVHINKARAQQARDDKKVERFAAWLTTIDQALRELFHDPTLTLQFDHKNSTVTIASQQYGSRTFSQLSDGQRRILSIFCDLLMRMECIPSNKSRSDFPGIVLIDNLEHLLHIDVQKRMLPCLVNFFPNLQFLVSTHSPFVMNSLESAIVFDLDRHATVNDLLPDPYEAILERYDLRKYSDQIRQLLGEYEGLLNQKMKTEKEEFRLLELGNYLAWVLTKFRKGKQNVTSNK